MKVTIRYTNRKRKNKHGFRKRMGTKSGRAILARRRKKGRREISAQLNYSISSTDFNHLVKISKSLSIGDLSFNYIFQPHPVLGFIVSKKYGNSVNRNLFKRRCRNLFRNELVKRKINIALIVIPRKKNVSFLNISTSFRILYEKLRD